MDISCYSQRILNPFRGVMNIITNGRGDAVTIDGTNWALYIHDSFSSNPDDPEEFANIELPDIRYGEWSEQNGLKRAPLLPGYHFDEIQDIGEELLAALYLYADKIPFAFQDNYELWLLDEEHHQPLALLDSVCNENEIHTPATLQWKAGNRCRQYFNSRVISNAEEKTHADLLNQLVNARAGNNPCAQWFLRKEDAHGVGLDVINTNKKYIGRGMTPRMFPRMFVEQQWEDDSESALFDEFIHWLSPWLLLMDFLSDSQRRNFEAVARKHAMLVDEMHRLYPKVINEQEIKAARVEAALRKAAPVTGEADESLDTCYVET